MIIMICLAANSKGDSATKQVYNWLVGQFCLDSLSLIRELTLIAVFKKAEDPNRYDLIISVVQITVIWSLTLAWVVYGLSLQCSDYSVSLCRL